MAVGVRFISTTARRRIEEGLSINAGRMERSSTTALCGGGGWQRYEDALASRCALKVLFISIIIITLLKVLVPLKENAGQEGGRVLSIWSLGFLSYVSSPSSEVKSAMCCRCAQVKDRTQREGGALSWQILQRLGWILPQCLYTTHSPRGSQQPANRTIFRTWLCEGEHGVSHTLPFSAARV